MDLLACILLRKEANRYQLKHAFNLLKNHPQRINNVSFRDKMAFGDNSNSTPSVEIENRELYLGYMEDVLKNKEKQLGRIEQELLQKKRQLEQWEAQCKLAQPVEMTHLAEFVEKKCQLLIDLLRKYSEQYPQLELDQEYFQFIENVDFLKQTCSENYRLLKEDLISNHQELMNEREQIQRKINKLHQLDSYEKYLTQLQHVLEQKQLNVIQKEESLKENSIHKSKAKNQANVTLDLDIEESTPQYNTYQQDNNTINSSIAQRKRSRIFDTKLAPKPHQISAHKESSKIMQERSTGEQIPSIINAPYIIEQFPAQEQTIDISVQTNIADPRITASHFIHNQYLYLKFVKLWLKYSEKRCKSPCSQHALTMNLYRWRLNALYDEGIKNSAKDITMWPLKLQKLGNLSYFNYAQLTLKKQKYLENFFDFERRKFQRQKIVTALKYIIKNKNRKERIAVFVIFKKFRQVCKTILFYKLVPSHTTSQTEALRQITTQPSQPTYLAHSRAQKESIMNTHSSGFIEQPLKQSQQKSRTSGKQNKFKGIPKQNKENNIDIIKLKEYIKAQEETEVKLAVQCARTEAVYKMLGALKSGTNKMKLTFMMKLIRLDQADRVQTLERAVGCYQFKWELFMAKARLALTSNNNKISHLQQLLSFVGTDK